MDRNEDEYINEPLNLAGLQDTEKKGSKISFLSFMIIKKLDVK